LHDIHYAEILCRRAFISLQYECASGVYHNVFNINESNHIASALTICNAVRYLAPCFQYSMALLGDAGAFVWSHRCMSMPSYHAIRACIFGVSTIGFPMYDGFLSRSYTSGMDGSNEEGRFDFLSESAYRHGKALHCFHPHILCACGNRKRPSTLRRWCSQFTSGVSQFSHSIEDDLRWLACVHGSMFWLYGTGGWIDQFDVPPWVVRDVCEQANVSLPPASFHICIRTALYRAFVGLIGMNQYHGWDWSIFEA
jgi:hypothetical protein